MSCCPCGRYIQHSIMRQEQCRRFWFVWKRLDTYALFRRDLLTFFKTNFGILHSSTRIEYVRLLNILISKPFRSCRVAKCWTVILMELGWSVLSEVKLGLGECQRRADSQLAVSRSNMRWNKSAQYMEFVLMIGKRPALLSIERSHWYQTEFMLKKGSNSSWRTSKTDIVENKTSPTQRYSTQLHKVIFQQASVMKANFTPTKSSSICSIDGK